MSFQNRCQFLLVQSNNSVKLAHCQVPADTHNCWNTSVAAKLLFKFVTRNLTLMQHWWQLTCFSNCTWIERNLVSFRPSETVRCRLWQKHDNLSFLEPAIMTLFTELSSLSGNSSQLCGSSTSMVPSLSSTWSSSARGKRTVKALHILVALSVTIWSILWRSSYSSTTESKAAAMHSPVCDPMKRSMASNPFFSVNSPSFI